MYNFDQVGLSVPYILSKVSDEVLWRYYLGFDFKVPGTYKSPLRHDSQPSFSLFYRYGRLRAKDHVSGGFVGDVFDYVSLIYKLTYTQTLRRVYEDFKLGTRQLEPVLSLIIDKPRVVLPKATEILYEAIMRQYNDYDIEYWFSYGISYDTLLYYDVSCVNILYSNGLCCYTYQYGDPCYEYLFKSGHSKYYRPFASKNLKFRGNINNNEDMQGYWQCTMNKEDPGNILVLTKSMKDVMLLHEYGIEAVAIHGESHSYNEDFLRHVQERYHLVVSLYDKDRAGICGARQLWREYRIPALFVPKGCGKDISDMKKNKKDVEGFISKIKCLVN